MAVTILNGSRQNVTESGCVLEMNWKGIPFKSTWDGL